MLALSSLWNALRNAFRPRLSVSERLRASLEDGVAAVQKADIPLCRTWVEFSRRDPILVVAVRRDEDSQAWLFSAMETARGISLSRTTVAEPGDTLGMFAERLYVEESQDCFGLVVIGQHSVFAATANLCLRVIEITEDGFVTAVPIDLSPPTFSPHPAERAELFRAFLKEQDDRLQMSPRMFHLATGVAARNVRPGVCFCLRFSDDCMAQ